MESYTNPQMPFLNSSFREIVAADLLVAHLLTLKLYMKVGIYETGKKVVNISDCTEPFSVSYYSYSFSFELCLEFCKGQNLLEQSQ